MCLPENLRNTMLIALLGRPRRPQYCLYFHTLQYNSTTGFTPQSVILSSLYFRRQFSVLEEIPKTIWRNKWSVCFTSLLISIRQYLRYYNMPGSTLLLGFCTLSIVRCKRMMPWDLHLLRKVIWLSFLASWIFRRSNFLKEGYIPGPYRLYK
jgi:hypothetical protein